MDDNHNPITVEELEEFKPGTPRSRILCFVYTNSDFGFTPAEVREHVSLPRSSVQKTLTQLFERDLIGQTARGYYHSLDDPLIANHIQRLKTGEEFVLDEGGEEYPDEM